MYHYLASVIAASLVAAPAGQAGDLKPPHPNHPVLEFRQYKLAAGAQDRFISLFDKEFVESQEALGIRLVGQFHDHDRRDRFTWLREFPNMTDRARMLQEFYFGRVWGQFKAAANPMLDDNDNVLLLRPARDGSGFGPSGQRAAAGASSKRSDTYFAVIEYLWKTPDDGFSSFFLDQMRPLLNEAGLPVLGVYVPEEEPNNFPHLPVRADKKILVWFTKASNPGAFHAIQAKLQATAGWQTSIATALDNAEERPPQVLILDPTPRSALR